MALRQDDLFGTAPTPVADGPSAEVLAMVRKQLHTTLALVKAAPAMPWSDMLTIIREDNAFLYGKNLLPEAEGAALWAEFDVEMDRLYAIMNEGMELDPET
jgi:hypothetical protein